MWWAVGGSLRESDTVREAPPTGTFAGRLIPRRV